MQRRIGLTGGIASGKSSVGNLLANGGWPVLDADRYSREALAAGMDTTTKVLDHFGARIRSEEGSSSIDRAALARIVFNDADERRWLEQLLHPLIQERFQAELTARTMEPVVVLMIPLLYEAGLSHLCSEVWLVDCDESQQLNRLMQRNSLSETEARQRLAAQWPLSEKRKHADRIIDNRGSFEALNEKVNALMSAG